MIDLNFFKNSEFEEKKQKVINEIQDYLYEKNYKLEELSIEELIQWKDQNETRKIFVNEKCPKEINEIILDFIKKEF